MYTATIWVKALNFTDEQLATLQSCTPPEAFIQHITAGSLDELAAPTPEDKPNAHSCASCHTRRRFHLSASCACATLEDPSPV